MKTLLIGGNFNNSGGTERVASIIANELSRHGHDVVVVSVNEGDHPFFKLDPKIKVSALFRTAGRNLFRAPMLIGKLRRLLMGEQPDAMIVVESMLALFTIPASLGLPIRHVCWEHFSFNNDLGRKGRRVARQLAARFCDVVVTLTEIDRRSWLRHTKQCAQIVTIPNPSPFLVRHEHTPAVDSRVVLAIGRLVSVKGFDLLLASWRRVSPYAPGWRLRIVGDGPDCKMLVAAAASYGIASTVDFVSATANVEHHYGEAAIYCLSSRFEGFGMVLIEAMAFGIPAVSFDCEAGPAEVLEGTGSRLVPPEDVDALSRALLALMRDPEERKHISTLSKIKAEQYQPSAIMPRWLEVLEGALRR